MGGSGPQHRHHHAAPVGVVSGERGTFVLRGHLLPGGQRREVYVHDGVITFQQVPRARTLADRGWIVPGLVDAHAHLGLASPAPSTASPEERAQASARAHLRAGVLAVREPGGPNRASRNIGPHLGLPRTFTGGRFLAPPGGYFPGLAREVSAADLPSAVADEGTASGAWTKIVGDFFGADGRFHSNWDFETLRAAADAAHSVGARIAVHAMTEQVITDSVRAGFDSVEHGNELTRELIDLFLEHGTTYVPTLSILAPLRTMLPQMLTAEASAAIMPRLDAQPATVAAAASAGVRVLAGTDAGMGPHGQVAHEVELLLNAGLAAEDAIAAASWSAREYLGLPGIVEGAPADLVVFDADPRLEPETLTRPAVIVLDGVVVDISALI